MRIISDVTGKIYSTVEECQKAEELYAYEQEQKKKAEEARKLEEKKKQTERAKDAKEVDEIRQEMFAAQKKYREAVDKFVKKYGSYHFSVDSFDNFPHLFDFIL
jgi:hypothetical protein